MNIKHSANVDGLLPAMWYATGVVKAVYKRHGFAATLTSGLDSHDQRPTSLHLQGKAADYRIHTIPASTLAFIVSDLKEFLESEGFDVVLENDHIHVEYDPKNGETWLERVS